MKKQKWTLKDIPDLAGKIIIVTGANSGIGYETTKALAMANAKVIMGCRSIERGNEAKNKIISEYKNADLDVLLLDLNDFEAIQKFADEIKKTYSKIDVLHNNAGIMSFPYEQTKNGLEKIIGVNHFGHFYLTMELLPLLNKTEKSRIVSIASIAHRFGKLNPSSFNYKEGTKYKKSFAYAQSKLANLLFTYGLKSRLDKLGSNILVLAAHPGVTRTNLGRHVKSLRFRPVRKLIERFNSTTDQGALPGIRACTDPTVKSGEYYGPDGFYGIKGYPVLEKSTTRSHSVKLQDILWEFSEKSTNKNINL